MASIALATIADGALVVSADHRNNYAALQAALNGGLDDSNLAPAAAISLSKLAQTGILVQNSNGRMQTLTATLLGTGSADKNNNLAVALAYTVPLGAGSNGNRPGGDSIANDAANSGTTVPAAEFFAAEYLNNTVTEKGSHQGIWNQMVVNEGTVADVYNEAVGYFGPHTTNRRGVLSECIEVGNTINAGKVARATAGTFAVNDANALAAYTAAVFGAGSPWIDTGSRVLWLLSGGAAGAGTGAYLDGTFARAAIYTKAAGAGSLFLASRVAGDAVDRYTLDTAGRQNWNADLTFERVSAGRGKFTGLIDITAELIARSGAAGQTIIGLGALGGSAGKEAVSFGTAQDLHLYRSAAGFGRSDHEWVFDGGVGTKVKAGTPVDGDFASAVSGLIVVDTTASKIWVRVGATWKSVAVA